MTRSLPNKAQPMGVSQLLASTTDAIRAALPDAWEITPETEPRLDAPGSRTLRPNLVLVLRAPDASTARLVVEAKTTRNIPHLIEQAGEQVRSYVLQLEDSGLSASGVIAVPYLGRAGRERLRSLGIGYADSTGNLRIQVDRPAVFIQSAGADRDPWPPAGHLQSLKGPGAASAVRALVDFVPPFGIRELASRAGAAPATLSRVAAMLQREALLATGSDGAIISVDWQGVIQRWADDYSVTRTNLASSFLDPRGVTKFADALRQLDCQYAVSGTIALPDEVAIAPPRLALVYSPDAAEIARATRLTRTDRGANVLLLEPRSRAVFARIREVRGLPSVALTQVAVDLLTSPGRGPSEARELIKWMQPNEGVWRA
ncbi:MAG: type IV toxin-antitoxin system AbiEi family antitoxin [Actinomycetota bacterium]